MRKSVLAQSGIVPAAVHLPPSASRRAGAATHAGNRRVVRMAEEQAVMLPQRSLREHGAVPLDDRRARELRNAGKKADEWRERRDELIRLAHDEGGSLREIGGLVGLSHVAVMKILARPGLVVNHIVPIAEGGDPNDPENIELVTEEENIRLALKDRRRREQGG